MIAVFCPLRFLTRFSSLFPLELRNAASGFAGVFSASQVHLVVSSLSLGRLFLWGPVWVLHGVRTLSLQTFQGLFENDDLFFSGWGQNLFRLQPLGNTLCLCPHSDRGKYVCGGLTCAGSPCPPAVWGAWVEISCWPEQLPCLRSPSSSTPGWLNG